MPPAVRIVLRVWVSGYRGYGVSTTEGGRCCAWEGASEPDLLRMREADRRLGAEKHHDHRRRQRPEAGGPDQEGQAPGELCAGLDRVRIRTPVGFREQTSCFAFVVL